MASNLVPGMFHILSRHDTMDPIAAAVIDAIKGDLDEYGGYPSTAMYNMIGVLQYKLRDVEGAVKSFKQVLCLDEENVNASEHCLIACENSGLMKDAQQYRKKMKALLCNRELTSVRIREARCFAEQGYALMTDFRFMETPNEIGGDDFERYVSARLYLERALQYDLFDLEEQLQWQYFLAQAYHHIHGHYFRMGYPDTERVDLFDRAVRLLKEVTSNSWEKNYQARAWGLIGTFFVERVCKLC